MIRNALIAAGALAVLATGGQALAQSLASLSNKDAVAGLKDALVQSAGKAVGQLGAADGFLGNAKVKIPLPDSIKRVESGLRMLGMGRQADELVVSMNRAAEMAVKEATPILVDSVKKMSVQDAKGVLTGGDDAATQYFKRTTSDALTQRFLPIVKRATAKVKLAETYNRFAGKAADFNLLDKKDADLDTYVTQKTLDGLFLMIADEEETIRENPAAAAKSIVKKVFGAIGQ